MGTADQIPSHWCSAQPQPLSPPWKFGWEVMVGEDYKFQLRVGLSGNWPPSCSYLWAPSHTKGQSYHSGDCKGF